MVGVTLEDKKSGPNGEQRQGVVMGFMGPGVCVCVSIGMKDPPDPPTHPQDKRGVQQLTVGGGDSRNKLTFQCSHLGTGHQLKLLQHLQRLI